MTTVRKYSFGAEFDTSRGGGRRTRTYSEAEVVALKAQAIEEGRAAGRHEAETSIEAANAAAVTRTLERIAEECAAQRPKIAERTEEARKAVLEVAVAICRKVVPALADRGAAEEVSKLVSTTLTELTEEPRVVVRVAPALVEPLTAHLKLIEAGFSGKLVLLGDEAIAAGDCAILWADGGIERDNARVLASIDAAVERHLSLPASRPGTDLSAPETTNT